MSTIFDIDEITLEKPVEESFDIHIGLTDDFADMFTSQLERFGVHVVPTEDGWEQWEVEKGTGQNDQNTRHVVLRFARLQDAIPAAIEIVNRYQNILVPQGRQITDETRNGLVLAVSFAHNWDERIAEITRTPSRTHIIRFNPQQTALPYK